MTVASTPKCARHVTSASATRWFASPFGPAAGLRLLQQRAVRQLVVADRRRASNSVSCVVARRRPARRPLARRARAADRRRVGDEIRDSPCHVDRRLERAARERRQLGDVVRARCALARATRVCARCDRVAGAAEDARRGSRRSGRAPRRSSGGRRGSWRRSCRARARRATRGRRRARPPWRGAERQHQPGERDGEAEPERADVDQRAPRDHQPAERDEDDRRQVRGGADRAL